MTSVQLIRKIRLLITTSGFQINNLRHRRSIITPSGNRVIM